MYEKAIKNQYGDGVSVTVEDDGFVWLSVSDHGEVCSDDLMPTTARKIAKALKRAANVAEGKPAKQPKSVQDVDGDRWYLCPNGFYSLTKDSDAARSTLDFIAEAYGPIR
ncbi:hypothetical protein OG474_09725 [Kribbella sp. NBC_01505]|uniref:hypothetical protein n=1 Tax=Kribbella sp. NBC_01505 TaxID=2903580 RepID=UPI00386FF1D3